jgi:hypothetical protein
MIVENEKTANIRDELEVKVFLYYAKRGGANEIQVVWERTRVVNGEDERSDEDHIRASYTYELSVVGQDLMQVKCVDGVTRDVKVIEHAKAARAWAEAKRVGS